MKKVSLFFIALFSVGFLMAQNTVNLTQTGGNQNATIGQTGANGAEVSQSSDDGLAQRANVSQKGSSTVKITQIESGPDYPGQSNPIQTADVVQDGATNKATIWQSETGDGGKALNTAKLDQLGNSNTSLQKTNTPGYNSGVAVIGYQKGDGNTISQDITSGHTEYFKAEQKGDGNKATQTGSGSNADGTIYQEGNLNEATQTLSGMNNGYYRTGMLIKQIGGNNKATQEFWGNDYGYGNSGETYQTGYRNTATQTGSGHHFTSIVTQNGDDNTTTVKQNGTASPLLVDNSVELYQFANGNIANITQELGSSNTLKLYQTGGGTANLTQRGNQNIVKGLSSVATFDASWAKFGGSKLDVTQTGKLNSLSMEADGIVEVTQNNSTVASATGNIIEFSQAGGGTSKLSQTGGDANLVKLTKTGGGNADITQTGNTNKVAMFDNVFGAAGVTGAALFNGADLDITQIGEGNLLNLNSTSAAADVDVMQNGMANKASISQQ